MKTLCPIDHSKEREKAEGEGENNTKRKRRRDESARGNNHQPSFAHTLSLGGRRVLMCNFNGIMFQVGREGKEGENRGASLKGDRGERKERNSLTLPSSLPLISHRSLWTVTTVKTTAVVGMVLIMRRTVGMILQYLRKIMRTLCIRALMKMVSIVMKMLTNQI